MLGVLAGRKRSLPSNAAQTGGKQGSSGIGMGSSPVASEQTADRRSAGGSGSDVRPVPGWSIPALAISRYRVIVVCGVFGGVLVCPGSPTVVGSPLRRPWGARGECVCLWVVWLSRRLWGWGHIACDLRHAGGLVAALCPIVSLTCRLVPFVSPGSWAWAVAPVWKWPCWTCRVIRGLSRKIGVLDSAKADK